jgi:hypothetical protein
VVHGDFCCWLMRASVGGSGVPTVVFCKVADKRGGAVMKLSWSGGILLIVPVSLAISALDVFSRCS